jgi:hypothetical protein
MAAFQVLPKLLLIQSSTLGPILYMFRHQVERWTIADYEHRARAQPCAGLASDPKANFHWTSSLLCRLRDL